MPFKSELIVEGTALCPASQLELADEGLSPISSIAIACIAASSLSDQTPLVKNIQGQVFVSQSNVKHSEQDLVHKKKVDPVLLENFKKSLENLRCRHQDFKTEMEALFEKIPEHCDLDDLVDFIFSKIDKSEIPSFLDAICLKHPSFSLSPYNEMRKKIIADKDHSLNNEVVLGFFEKNKESITQEEILSCYDLAYTSNHPYIYPLAETPVSSSEYNLNFLWVNLNPQDREKDAAQNIFGDGLNLSENAESIQDPTSKSFISRITKWASVNPEAEVNLWYDSALVTEKARKKTFEMMQSISESKGVNLKLRDVRSCLKHIIARPDIGNSLHPATPVYYRVDLLKVLIADSMIRYSEDSPKYCVVSDIDVDPMSSEQLFDKRTLEFLSARGYVFSRNGIPGFENDFFVFNKEKKDLSKKHFHSMIQGLIRKIKDTKPRSFCREYALHSQSVFSLYDDFFEKMGESPKSENPRKVIKSPPTQFGSTFPFEDHRSELFYFPLNKSIPYTHGGRNSNAYNSYSMHGPIKSLASWEAEPLK